MLTSASELVSPTLGIPSPIPASGLCWSRWAQAFTHPRARAFTHPRAQAFMNPRARAFMHPRACSLRWNELSLSTYCCTSGCALGSKMNGPKPCSYRALSTYEACSKCTEPLHASSLGPQLLARCLDCDTCSGRRSELLATTQGASASVFFLILWFIVHRLPSEPSPDTTPMVSPPPFLAHKPSSCLFPT